MCNQFKIKTVAETRFLPVRAQLATGSNVETVAPSSACLLNQIGAAILFASLETGSLELRELKKETGQPF